MCEILRPQFGSHPRSVDARSAAFANIERHSVLAIEGNTVSEMCLSVLSRFPDDVVSGPARRALEELAGMGDAPSEVNHDDGPGAD